MTPAEDVDYRYSYFRARHQPSMLSRRETELRVEYVDPANVVHSYTEDPYFKDCFYWGEHKRMSG